jgi:protein-S-isoprenylcysteine O-methyltransferase Ste14
VVAQHQMGQDWRIGIDVKHKTSLVTRGLYTTSRHPIYLGFIVITIGLFFAVPNVVSLVCAVLLTVVLSIEARLEEQFLLSRHGDIYREYLAHTRRWI